MIAQSLINMLLADPEATVLIQIDQQPPKTLEARHILQNLDARVWVISVPLIQAQGRDPELINN